VRLADGVRLGGLAGVGGWVACVVGPGAGLGLGGGGGGGGGGGSSVETVALMVPAWPHANVKVHTMGTGSCRTTGGGSV
jgi:hypothetical protein